MKKKGDSTHRRTCHWGWGLQQQPPPPPQILGNSDILGIAAREIWAKPIFTKLCMFGFFFPLKELFFILSLSRRCKGSYIGR